MEASTLTPAAHASLTEAAVLLNATAGFAFLPVFCTSERAAASALGVLRSKVPLAGQVVAWPAPRGHVAAEAAVLQAAREDLAALLEHFDGAVALLPHGSMLVLNAASSVWDAVARLLPAQLNFRREPLRTKGLCLVLMWPVALRDELMSGAPDLWSMRLLSPWADEQSMAPRDAALLELTPSALTDPAMDDAQMSPAQQARYAAWRAHRDLNESLLSVNDGLELVGDLYERRRWHEALDLAEWLEALLVQQDRSPERQYALAGSQHWIGLVRSALGDRFGALEPTQRATANLRALVRTNPAAFSSNLAGSLTNLSGRLSDVGQFEAAIEPAQEALAIYRRLAAEEPSVYESSLASSLNNLANRMSGIGKPDLALPFALESAAIRRRLAQANVPEDGLNLALSLRNLSTRLMETGHHSSALAAVQEAVVINRRLATSDPAIYERDLAMSLMGLAECRNAVGQLPAAVAAAEDAVGILRRLTRDRPSVIEPDLAKSLWTSMRCLAATGATPLARARGNEALSIFTRLADALPEAFSRRRDAVVQELKILLQPSS